MYHAGYAFREIARMLGAPSYGAPPTGPIRYLSHDSRSLRNGRDTLFVALEGARRAGADFAAEAYGKGVRAFLLPAARWSENWPAAFPEAGFLLADDPLAALQRLAAMHRKRFAVPVAAVTGSNGKTVVKEWLLQLSMPDLRVVHSPKSYNSQLGVPLSVWQMAPEHDFGIFEAGISQRGEMQHLARVIQPTGGIFTNLGSAHDAGFAHRAEKAREKAQLFAACTGPVVYRMDYPDIHRALSELPGCESPQGLVAWSTQHEAADYFVKKEAHRFTLRGKQGHWRFPLPFADAAGLENCAHLAIFLLESGWAADTIAARMAHLEPVAQRLELRRGRYDSLLINDAYNADLESLRIALDFLQEQAGTRSQTLVLTDMLQSGLDEETLYQAVGKLLERYPLKRVLAVGEGIGRYAGRLHPQAQTFADTAALEHSLLAHPPRGEALLLKGARVFALEKVLRRLESQRHQTVLEINLGALARNLEAYRLHVPRGVRLMAMLKAFGYGSGDREIAGMLARRGVDYLAVAYADEGVQLREGGIQLPIVVLNPEAESFEAMLRYCLEPELYSSALWAEFAQSVRQEGLQAYPVHLKLDTGMHRMGFLEPDWYAWLDRGSWARDPLRVATVFSHLAVADDPAEDAYTRAQIEAFERMSEALLVRLPYRPLRHLLPSAGIGRFPEATYDMVRLGLGLYGVDPGGTLPLEPISRWVTTVSQVKALPPGATVGYGRAGRLPKGGRIAVLAIGYADGFRRSLSQGVGGAYLHGQWAPVIGNVCMDATMVEVSHIEGVQVGDEAVLFDEHFPVEMFAQRMGVIPYEVFTSVGRRVRRVYYSD